MNSNNEVANLDRQTEQLLECKPLKEIEVKHLCEKVSLYFE